jgi:putative ABC transport system permease protein
MLSSFWADLRYGAQAVSTRSTFAAVVILTLALGIGVNVAIFSLAEQILLRPLPVPEPDRLVNLTDPGPKTIGRISAALRPLARPSSSGGPETVFSYPMFRDLERAQEPFVGLAAHRLIPMSLSTGEPARLGNGIVVSGNYFSLLGLQPALGRLLGPQDDQVDGVAESVVLSYSYWQSEFGGDSDVLGRTLVVNDVSLTIVGVAPRGFRGTLLSASLAPVSVFVPITISFRSSDSGSSAAFAMPNHERRDYYWAHLFGRLKPGVTRDAAAAAMNPLFSAILSEVEAPRLLEVDEQQRDAFRTRPLVLEPGARGQTSSQILSQTRIGLMLLLALSVVILLLCCANVAGLMLLRGTARSGEMALRASMGATRGRLASLLFAESLVLALPAALISLAVALFILRGSSRLSGLPEPMPSILEAVSGLDLSATAALVAIGMAIVAGLLVGLLPMRNLIRTEPGKALQTFGARHTPARGVARFRATLATVQVALSMALLATTGAFAHSLANIASLDLGLDIDSVVMVSVEKPGGSGIDFARIREALGAIPGVSAVASSTEPLLSSQGSITVPVSVEGGETALQPVSVHFVSPNLFQNLGIGLLAGREFSETDREQAVSIVSRRFAERFGLNRDEIVGRTVDYGFGPSEIVGVVDDVRAGKITNENSLHIFRPTGLSGNFSTFYVRGDLPPDEMMNAVRETFVRVDPTIPITFLGTMEQQFRDSIGFERFFAGASTAFAVLATALAALGLYGILAYSVAQRSREIGLRFALGAPVARIRVMVLRQVAGIALIGIVLGVIAAWLLGVAARSMLFGVEAGDPLALVGAVAVLVVATVGAAYIPARRASRVDPMTVLRYE